MSTWDRWGRPLLLAGLAIVTGAFARKTYERKVRLIGRGFEAGERSLRDGTFTCDGCGERFSVTAGDTLPPCPACGSAYSTKTG